MFPQICFSNQDGALHLPILHDCLDKLFAVADTEKEFGVIGIDLLTVKEPEQIDFVPKELGGVGEHLETEIKFFLDAFRM